MFTGSTVRVQAVQDLKLQEEQEIGRRSWEGGRQHPRSPAGTKRMEGKEEEVEEGERGRRTGGKPQNPKFVP
jgi:hypothetical protein